MSPGTATPELPAALISSNTSVFFNASSMSLTTTVAPAQARPIASDRPNPAAAPVTTATRPDKSEFSAGAAGPATSSTGAAGPASPSTGSRPAFNPSDALNL